MITGHRNAGLRPPCGTPQNDCCGLCGCSCCEAQVYDACQPPMLPSWECRIVATVRHLKTAVPAASPCVPRSVSRGPATHVELCRFSKCVLQVCEVHVSRDVTCIETSACSQPAKRIYIYIHTEYPAPALQVHDPCDLICSLHSTLRPHLGWGGGKRGRQNLLPCSAYTLARKGSLSRR